VPRYFFDIRQGGHVDHDDTGLELPDLHAVRREAMHALPEIARDELPRDGDCQKIALLATGEDGRPVYSATLNYSGLWLSR
jgi:hypothetical protein